jgi:hypothetical protein
MKTFLLNLLKWTLTITTGITLIVGISVMKYDTIPAITIPRIFIAGILTSLVTTVFFSYEPKKKVGKGFGFVFFLLHYLSMVIVMAIIGISFGWFDFSVKGILTIGLSVGGVYLFTVLISLMLSKGEAQKMNEALKNLDDSKSE